MTFILSNKTLLKQTMLNVNCSCATIYFFNYNLKEYSIQIDQWSSEKGLNVKDDLEDELLNNDTEK